MADGKFLGMPYPIRRRARGLLATQAGIDQIKSDILALLLTNQGERVMLPEFGASLRRFLFEPNDRILRQQVRNFIVNQIEIWEPRIVIEAVDITTRPSARQVGNQDSDDELDSALLVSIMFFDPENIQEIQTLKLEVPIPGA